MTVDEKRRWFEQRATAYAALADCTVLTREETEQVRDHIQWASGSHEYSEYGLKSLHAALALLGDPLAVLAKKVTALERERDEAIRAQRGTLLESDERGAKMNELSARVARLVQERDEARERAKGAEYNEGMTITDLNYEKAHNQLLAERVARLEAALREIGRPLTSLQKAKQLARAALDKEDT